MAAEEGEDVQLIFCKKRKFLCSENGNLYSEDVKSSENSLSSAASVACGCSEEDESSDDVLKGSRSPDLGNVDSKESETEGFETEISTPINGRFSNLSIPTTTSELCGDSEEVSMGSSTPKKKQSSQAVKCSRDIAHPAAEKLPTAEEIEEFFAVAENCDQKRFTEKYNYDFVKDVPLAGRYQWVRLRP